MQFKRDFFLLNTHCISYRRESNVGFELNEGTIIKGYNKRWTRFLLTICTTCYHSFKQENVTAGATDRKKQLIEETTFFKKKFRVKWTEGDNLKVSRLNLQILPCPKWGWGTAKWFFSLPKRLRCFATILTRKEGRFLHKFASKQIMA